MYHLHAHPESNVHGANMRPTWVLSAPDGPHVGPMSQLSVSHTVVSSPYHGCFFIARTRIFSVMSSLFYNGTDMCHPLYIPQVPSRNTLIRDTLIRFLKSTAHQDKVPTLSVVRLQSAVGSVPGWLPSTAIQEPCSWKLVTTVKHLVQVAPNLKT